MFLAFSLFVSPAQADDTNTAAVTPHNPAVVVVDPVPTWRHRLVRNVSPLLPFVSRGQWARRQPIYRDHVSEHFIHSSTQAVPGERTGGPHP